MIALYTVMFVLLLVSFFFDRISLPFIILSAFMLGKYFTETGYQLPEGV